MSEMRSEHLSSGYLAGAVDIVVTKDHGLQAWRLPYDRLGLFPPDEALPVLASMGSGVRLRCRTNADRIDLHADPHDIERRFEITGDDDEFLARAVLPAGESVVHFTGLPTDYGERRIWLPQNAPCILRELGVSAGARLDPKTTPRKHWVHYGSSISQCNGAHGPAHTWPAIAARTLHLDLTSFGFSGNCHLDPMVAMVIAEQPMHVLTLKLGINVCGGMTLNPRTWRAAIIGFIRIIRAHHPILPIGLVTSICCPPRETTPNAVGMSLQQMRDDLADAVDRLRAAGDDYLRVFDGHKILGPDDTAWLLADEVHPSADGYANMGPRFVDHVLRPLCHEFSIR